MPEFTPLPDDFQFQFPPMNASQLSVMSLGLLALHAFFQGGPVYAIIELQHGLQILFENGADPKRLAESLDGIMTNVEKLEQHIKETLDAQQETSSG